jgi:hypothetical protein
MADGLHALELNKIMKAPAFQEAVMGETQADSGHLENPGHSNQLGVPRERYCGD